MGIYAISAALGFSTMSAAAGLGAASGAAVPPAPSTPWTMPQWVNTIHVMECVCWMAAGWALGLEAMHY